MVQLAGGFLPAAYWDGGGKFVYPPFYAFVVLLFSVGIASAPAFRQHHRAIPLRLPPRRCGLDIRRCVLSWNVLEARHTSGRLHEGSECGRRDGDDLGNSNGRLDAQSGQRHASRLIAGTAVVATLSRGGMVLFAVAFLFYSAVLARSALQLYAKRLSMVLVAVAIIVPLYSIANLGSTVYSAGQPAGATPCRASEWRNSPC